MTRSPFAASAIDLPSEESSETHILVVDDDPLTQTLYASFLSDAGFIADAVDGIGPARTALEHAVPDLILLDSVLGSDSGLDLCRWLRTKPWGHDTPVIVTTGVEGTAAIDEAFEAGATDFLSKPTHKALLIQRVRSALRTVCDRSRLAASEALLAQTQELGSTGSYELLPGGEWLTCSAEFSMLLGGPRQSMSMQVSQFLGLCHEEDREAVAELFRRMAIDDGAVEDAVFRVHPSDERVRWLRHRVRTNDGRKLGTVQDITVDRERDAQSQRLETHDPMSGLLHERAFLDRLTTLLDRRSTNVPVSVLHLGIEGSSGLRLRFGVQLFNELVNLVVNRLELWATAATQGDEAIVGRISGLEFIVALSDVDAAAAAEQSVSLHALVDGLTSLAGYLTRMHASVGIATAPQDGENAWALVHAAGKARFAATTKNDGIWHNDGERSSGPEDNLQRESDFERALPLGQLALHYQPQIDHTGRVRSVEALLRWNHPTDGLLSPGRFIQTAENSGFILPLGKWIVQQAIIQAARWHLAGYALRVAVNVSPVQLSDSSLIPTIQTALARTGLPADLLELEITETALADPGVALDFAANLAADGVRFAMDDFGTGYSSLHQLTDIPLHVIKIDRSFVAQLPQPRILQIIKLIISLAAELGLQVLAEGVETEDQHNLLLDLGVNLFQGYLLGYPVPADQLTLLLAAES